LLLSLLQQRAFHNEKQKLATQREEGGREDACLLFDFVALDVVE